jgi:hypothetical protein
MSDSLSKALSGALDAVGVLNDANHALLTDRLTAVELLRGALRSIEHRQRALVLLRVLDPGFTIELVPDLVSVSLNHRNTLDAQETLRRLPRADAEHLIPSAVRRQLEITDDSDAYWRMAELLDHLGLDYALHQLRERARADDRPDVREVAEGYE